MLSEPEQDIGTVLVVAGLYGIYAPLAAGALWATGQESSVTATRLRWITICMFLLVTSQLVLEIWNWKVDYLLHVLPWTPDQLITWAAVWAMMRCIPALTGGLSDGILAWRCHVLFGRRRWLQWTLVFIIFANTVGFVVELLTVSEISIIWAATSLVFNTVLTGAMVVKLLRLGKRDMHDRVISRVGAAARVIIESSAVTWIGVTAYFATTLMTYHTITPLSAQNGGYEANLMVLAALSVLFGISQALVTARSGLSRFVASKAFESRVVALTTDFGSADAC